MKRYKRHKVKPEVPETSSAYTREQEEHDLAYYIHDRVELMHQVFSVLKYKELKAMAPACVRNISVDDLQELCTEELLGISSKRLCAILDGAEPPSDTESSSQSPTEHLETISLDSISSDEEILSQQEKSKKKKHKHRRRNSKSKSKRKKSSDEDNDEEVEKSKASRAGLTVLELLELQARARAIRAQLQQEQIKPATGSVAAESTQSTQSQSSEDEVEIKEEPAEIVEISSDEEKPKIEGLEKSNPQLKSPEPQSKTVTKRVNDLVITVPKHKTQKIKLNRNKSAPQETNTDNNITQNNEIAEKHVEVVNRDIPKDKTEIVKPKDATRAKENIKKDKSKEKPKKKKKKRLSNASDNDEITLQLSDSEKIDLLEDLDRKNYDNVSSETSSGSESDNDDSKKPTHTDSHSETIPSKVNNSKDEINLTQEEISSDGRKSNDTDEIVHLKQDVSIDFEDEAEKSQQTETDSIEIKETEFIEIENSNSVNDNANSRSTSHTDVEIVVEIKSKSENNETENIQSCDLPDQSEDVAAPSESSEKNKTSPSQVDDVADERSSSQENIDQPELGTIQNEREMSEGEISDRESSEVEAFDLKPQVVCISDEEEGKHRKKKKKKEKKSKKDKKSKKKDFRESSDQNFHKISENSKNPPVMVLDSFPTEREVIIHKEIIDDSSQSLLPEDLQKDTEVTEELSTVEIDLTTSEKSQDSFLCPVHSENAPASPNPDENPSDNDNLNIEDESPNEVVEISDEVYELSDDSSNEDEAETQNVLSKEPTTSEIEALSAKIDKIERVDVITEEEIKEYESKHKEEEEVTISWKDRYLDSKKVKRVLNTSNILNALRKKNKQLKKRLEESKVQIQEKINDLPPTIQVVQEETRESEISEGSIEHYNTLEGSTKFVDPVKEPPINDTLKKDAEQLLKMYKKLLKYNDMNRKKDPTKKKKKKKKGKKDKEKVRDSVENKVLE